MLSTRSLIAVFRRSRGYKPSMRPNVLDVIMERKAANRDDGILQPNHPVTPPDDVYPDSRFTKRVHDYLTAQALKSKNGLKNELLVKNDRYWKADAATSIKYLKSSTYKEFYGDIPIYEIWRDNQKGSIRRRSNANLLALRKSCYGKLQNEDPEKVFIKYKSVCPICRDPYLVFAPENVQLLQQFIRPLTKELHGNEYVSICQNQYEILQICVLQAQDRGFIHVPTKYYRTYDYAKYYPKDQYPTFKVTDIVPEDLNIKPRNVFDLDSEFPIVPTKF